MNVDTRKINVPLLFRTGMDAQTLRDFVRIDNQIYMLNSADYTIGTTGTTEAELIRINDTRNYTQGQSLIYPNSVLLIDALEQNMGYEGGTASIYVENTNVEDMRVVSDSGWISGYVERNSLILNVSYNGGDAERQGYVWIVGKDLGGFDVVSNAVAVKQAFDNTGGGDTGSTVDRRTMKFTIVSGDTWNNTKISAYTVDNRLIEPVSKTATEWVYPEDVDYMNGKDTFSDRNLKTFEGFGETVKIKNGYGFFSNNTKATSINCSKLDTSQASDMSLMFAYCSTLASLDVSNFDTSNVTDMGNMFYHCKALTSLDLSHFDTSKVTEIQYMFLNCEALETLNLSNWNLGNLMNKGNMFKYCYNLKTIIMRNCSTTTINEIKAALTEAGIESNVSVITE